MEELLKEILEVQRAQLIELRKINERAERAGNSRPSLKPLSALLDGMPKDVRGMLKPISDIIDEVER